jgi:hypothetical protein
VPHHQDADRIITAHLHGAATRHAGWRDPQGPAREAAIRELREIATVTPRAKHGAIHQPAGVLRADLLAEVAGVLLGAAGHLSRSEQNRIAAGLLIEAGADKDLIPKWTTIGRERTQPQGAPFSAAPATDQRRWP